MKNFLKFFLNYNLSLHRYSKRTLVIFVDAILCVACTWLAFVLRLEELILPRDFNFYPAIISIIIAIPIFWMFGLYRTVFRYTGTSIILTILFSTFIYGLVYFLAVGVYGIQSTQDYIGLTVPRSIGIIQPMLLFFAIVLLRLSARYILTNSINFSNKSLNKKKVLIYGAGDAGRQLVLALENNPEFEVIGFLDDNKNVIMEMEYPYRITDNVENIYKHAKNLYLPKVKKNSIFTIGVHVRRGELYVVDSDRMLPNSYYINLVKKLIKICEECGIQYIVKIKKIA